MCTASKQNRLLRVLVSNAVTLVSLVLWIYLGSTVAGFAQQAGQQGKPQGQPAAQTASGQAVGQGSGQTAAGQAAAAQAAPSASGAQGVASPSPGAGAQPVAQQAGGQSSSQAQTAERQFRPRLPMYYGQVVTEEQRQKIYDIQRKYFDKIEALRRQLEALIAERDKEIEAVLTPEQKAKIEQLRKEAAERRSSRRGQADQPQAQE
ncbi:MAG: hypothetical protein NZ899_15290 [Thermoguttaceae bacterium]|nr:hypothetical protein [Thermoguttaceae bacterium]